MLHRNVYWWYCKKFPTRQSKTATRVWVRDSLQIIIIIITITITVPITTVTITIIIRIA